MTVFGSRRAYKVLRGAKASVEAARGRMRSGAGRGARRRIAAKDAEIAALRRELARARGGEASEAAPEAASGAQGRTGTPVFFVVGQQKSGTTWLMRILDAHPEILCKGEGRFFGAGWRQESVKRRDPGRPPSSLLNALHGAEYVRLWVERSVWSRDDDPDEHMTNLARMAVDYFMLGELAKTGKRLVGDKSPLLTPETIREISAVHPEAKVIHIIRDGRDAAVSAAHHARNFGKARKNAGANAGDAGPPGGSIFAGPPLHKLAAEWAARVGKTVEDGPALLGPRYAEVRYEDLLERPEEEVGRILAFLGAGADAATARKCVAAASFEKLSKGRARGQEDAGSFFRKGVAGDWEHAFTAEDRLAFKEAAGDLLVKLGYEKDGSW